jgi:gluconolactonase
MKTMHRRRFLGQVSAIALVAGWVLVAGWALPAAAPLKAEEIGSIERLDEAFDELVPAEAKLEKLAKGFEWAEGPVWNRKENFVLFSDIPNNAVNKWQEGKGLSLFLKPAGYTGKTPRGGEPGSNGLLYDAAGNLILCQHGDRRIARLSGKKFVTLVDKYQGKRLNSPNDGAFKSNGDLYFTDPPYGLVEGEDDPARELDFCGVYRLAKNGKLTLLTDKMTRPNGIGFSPDEKTLYVAQSDPMEPIWMAYDVEEDGTLSGGRVFFDATELAKDENNKGLPDGLKIDDKGNLFATGPGGVLVFSPEGKHLGTLRTGERTANCGWGDDGSTLYITADMYLCRVKTSTRGAGF